MLLLIAATALPPEVAAFVERRGRCDHFRGEDSEDAERRAEIRHLLRENCAGTDAELRRLRERYRDGAPAEALRGFEDRVEPALR
ncbi:hypothetical protein ACE7GA_05295 [Roseomonas sp. CCTCC AB2023176]|uniref:hypothetical protein n=1 Tax=Roseomonas sp. CCTCC AB2023176 TaxID=3342640 RepID=UPI0035D5B361